MAELTVETLTPVHIRRLLPVYRVALRIRDIQRQMDAAWDRGDWGEFDTAHYAEEQAVGDLMTALDGVAGQGMVDEIYGPEQLELLLTVHRAAQHVRWADGAMRAKARPSPPEAAATQAVKHDAEQRLWRALRRAEGKIPKAISLGWFVRLLAAGEEGQRDG